MEPILEISGLETSFVTEEAGARVVDGVSLSLGRGEVLGLVGESGSGKSVTGLSVMRLVPRPGRVTGGRILFRGTDLLGLDAAGMRRIRGRHIAMIFQDPMSSLNPVLRIGTQMREAILAHETLGRAEIRARAAEMLGRVGIPRPAERLDAYPHEFSGGMRQRVAIAIALLHRPDIIIADEPTTALDVTIQAQILAKMQDLTEETGTSLIWITHDLGLVSGFADRIAVMYAGRIVEQGPIDLVLGRPVHPYTAGLLRSMPARGVRGEALAQIAGNAPSPFARPPGCAFHPRCPRATEICRTEPALLPFPGGREAACFHPLSEGALQ